MEATIDLANHWIADAGLRMPETNRDAFTCLEEAGEIDPELAGRLREWACRDARRVDAGRHRSDDAPDRQAPL